MRNASLSLLILFSVIGCSAASGSGGQQGSGGAGAGSGSGGDSSGAGDTGGSIFSGGVGGSGSGAGGGSSADCSDAAKLIYVLSDENDLYSFRPDMKQFKKIGPLGCQAGSMQPNSMAVDRNAVAWVNYVESDGFGDDTAGKIFQVSTADASCKSTSIKLGKGWYRLGMGYSTDMVGGTSETLFVTGTASTIGAGDSPGLGKIDFGTNTVKPVGQFTDGLGGESAELTGTGDARLYGFFTTSPVRVAEIDKASGAIKSNKAINQVQTPAAWAFSFWGGDFYLYTAPADDSVTTTVSSYRPSDGTVDAKYMTNIGFRIVGAGVSTCAPTEPPK